MNLYLIGYRGSGKSSVARVLSEMLSRPWCDADDLLEAEARCTIRDIFAKEGEAGFRSRETGILLQLAGRADWIIATGGGVILREENRLLLGKGRVVWLSAPAEVLWQRLQEDATTAQRRPNLGQGGLEEIQELLRVREPLYRQCAHLEVDAATKTPRQVAEIVAEWIQQRG